MKPETRVLVIAAHPDDEVLGCGGTIALHRLAGHPVTVVIAASGRDGTENSEGLPQHSFTADAMRELGVDDVRLLGFDDQRMDTLALQEIITPLEKISNEVRPTTIYCQYGGDINHDHAALFNAALVVMRPTHEHVRAAYAFYTSSSTEWGYPRSFVPDTWVDIGSTLDRKLAAMACYRHELREYPHPRSLEAIANTSKAFGNQCCLEAAEPFMTVRRVVRHVEEGL
jgi:LmbE family N-acetylglucosaminyl deacetylase